MTDFVRFLKLAGIPILMEAMTPTQAAAIFKSHGATDDDLASPQKVKLARNKLVKKLHSDVVGGNDDDVKYVNAAYDVLKALPAGFKDKSTSGYQNYGRRPYEAPEASTEEDNPAWQTDSRSSYNKINKDDYRDINFFKKMMWELSGKSHREFTIWAFDGYFFRSSTTVYGSEKIYRDMAEAMEIWNSHGANRYKTRAVFVQKGSDPTLYLIYVDGHYLDEPIVMEHDSFNMNPGNDQQFQRRLPEMLDKISASL